MSDAPVPPPLPPRPRSLADRVVAGIQYAYFLRFSILLLALAPILALVDHYSGFNSLTRGFFVPAKAYDFIGEVFFLMSAGALALVTSRLVVLNGKDRFGVEPPPLLTDWLGVCTDRSAGWILFAYQIPGICVLAYLLYVSQQENALYSVWSALGMSLIGSAIGAVFWASLNILYYWTANDGTGFPARTILLPRRFLGSASQVHSSVLRPPRFVRRTWLRIAALGAGYSSRRGVLYSGHQFAVIATVGFLLVYGALFPLTSPFTSGFGYPLALTLFLIVATYLGIHALKLKPPSIPWAKYFIASELLLLALGALLLLMSYFAPEHLGILKPAQSFPLLCSLLVMFSLIALLVCALAFFLDRFHIPVILASCALVFLAHTVTAALYSLPGMAHTRLRGASDHYFNVFAHKTEPKIATPEEIIAANQCAGLTQGTPCPIIFISATGGGIHAAAWTTEMLTELEAAFQKQAAATGNNYNFHDHVALFSTVSGGSAGLLPFLSEYYSPTPFDPKQWDTTKQRMVTASACSSLEGVAWGLEYRDFDTFMAPFTSGAFSPEWDRSAALEASMRRHLFEVGCDPLLKNQDANNRQPLFKTERTLAEFADGLYASSHPGTQSSAEHIPAFAMNTTAAETGGRFLLSNYHVPSSIGLSTGVAPAQDFLTAYGARPNRGFFPDIRITTAARLSATFPYVSSAARSDQMKVDEDTLHFVDGGYYDNDGVATVVEFLLAGESALGITPKAEEVTTIPQQNPPAQVAAEKKQKPMNLPVLLIEIRDGSDITTISPEEDANVPVDESESASGKKPKVQFAWDTMSQLDAPLGAFWSAGHSAVTRRNRRELETLMNLLESRHVAFEHIVLDYKKAKGDGTKAPQGASQPLSWSLTPSQVSDLDTAKNRVTPCIKAAVEWVQTALAQSGEKPVGGTPAVVPCAK